MSSLFAKAEPNKLVRSFTLTPGYLERTFNFNKMMKLGLLSLMQLFIFFEPTPEGSMS